MSASLLWRKVVQPTAEEDRELLAAAKTGDIPARNQLIERHMPFILMVACEYHRLRRPVHMEREDLAQVCVLGTIHAVQKYNPDKARGRFMFYAKFWMRNYMDAAVSFGKMFRVPESVLFQYKKGNLDRPASAKTKAAVEWFCEMGRMPDNQYVYSRDMAPDEEAIFHEEMALANGVRGLGRAKQ